MTLTRSLVFFTALLCPLGAAAQDASALDGSVDASADAAEVQVDAGAGSDGGAAAPDSGRRANDWSALPVVSYAPETSLAGGAFGVYFFRLGGAPAESRPSYVASAFTYTVRAQVLWDTYPEFWWNRENWVLTGQISYWNFPDNFYGLGNSTLASNVESYTLQTFFDRFDLRRRVYRSLFVGLRQDFQYSTLNEVTSNGAFARGGIPGQNGGIRSGLGPMLVLDSRDNTLAPHFGVYYLATLLTFQPWLGSDYTYSRFTLDARHYYTWRERHTLAVQLYASFSEGDVPFNALAMIGGKVLLRGYYEGRFRDRNMLMAQAEYRLMPLIWRFGLVAFAGVGEVASRFSDFRWDAMHWTVGGGIRFALNPAERINVRVDAGFGYDTWGVYANVLETF